MSPEAPEENLNTKTTESKVKTGVCPKCKSVFLYTEKLSCLELYGMCSFCVANDGNIVKSRPQPTTKKLMRRK